MSLNQNSVIPKWIRLVIDNPSLLNEYVLDMTQRKDAAIKEGIKAAREGNYSLSNTLLGKSEAYESLINSVLIHKTESEAQDAFQQKQNPGGKSARRRNTSG